MRERKGGWRIALDRTCFFPEEADSSGDVGSLYPAEGRAPVRHRDTQEAEGTIWQHTDRPLPVGTRVQGRSTGRCVFPDAVHRRAHRLRALPHPHGLGDVGFHLGDEEVTIDLSGPGDLGGRQGVKVERQANRAVAGDVAVVCAYPRREELEHPGIPCKLDPEKGHLRIVTISDMTGVPAARPSNGGGRGRWGSSTCSPCRRTGRGVRLRMLCGSQARWRMLMRKQERASRPFQSALGQAGGTWRRPPAE